MTGTVVGEACRVRRRGVAEVHRRRRVLADREVVELRIVGARAEHPYEVRPGCRDHEIGDRLGRPGPGAVDGDHHARRITDLEGQILNRPGVERGHRTGVAGAEAGIGVGPLWIDQPVRNHAHRQRVADVRIEREPIDVAGAVQAQLLFGLCGFERQRRGGARRVVRVVDQLEAIAVAPLHTADVVVLEAAKAEVDHRLHELRPVDGTDMVEAHAVTVLVGEHVVERRREVGRPEESVGGIDLHVAGVREEVVRQRVRVAVDVASADANVAAHVRQSASDRPFSTVVDRGAVRIERDRRRVDVARQRRPVVPDRLDLGLPVAGAVVRIELSDEVAGAGGVVVALRGHRGPVGDDAPREFEGVALQGAAVVQRGHLGEPTRGDLRSARPGRECGGGRSDVAQVGAGRVHRPESRMLRDARRRFRCRPGGQVDRCGDRARHPGNDDGQGRRNHRWPCSAQSLPRHHRGAPTAVTFTATSYIAQQRYS